MRKLHETLDDTLDDMDAYGMEKSAVTLGILVKAYGRVQDMGRVLDIWTKMG